MPSNFLYPRTISVRRQKVPASGTAGIQSYGGVGPAQEQVIAQNVQCAIQLDRVGTMSPSNLPSTTKLGYYKILIPAATLQLGTILKNDIIVDDQGQRYKVMEPYFTSLGYQLLTEIMAM